MREAIINYISSSVDLEWGKLMDKKVSDGATECDVNRDDIKKIAITVIQNALYLLER